MSCGNSQIHFAIACQPPYLPTQGKAKTRIQKHAAQPQLYLHRIKAKSRKPRCCPLPPCQLRLSGFKSPLTFPFLPDSLLVKGNRLHSIHMCRVHSQVFPSPSGQTTTEEMPEEEALVRSPKLRVHGQNHLVDFRTHFKEQPLDRTL